MTLQEYQDRFRHVLGGIVLDAATRNMTGAEKSLFLSQVMARIDALLAQQYHTLRPPVPQARPQPNGQVTRNQPCK